MYAVVSRIKSDATHHDKLRSLVQKNTNAPNPKGAKGVKNYFVLDLGGGEWATIAVFENEMAAKDWQTNARDFAKKANAPKAYGIIAAAGPVVEAVTN